MPICLKDNQYKFAPWNKAWDPWNREFRGCLEAIGGKSLNELCSDKWKEKNGEFLVFSFNNAEADLGRDDNFVYKLDWVKEQETDLEKPSFQTGNVMGFIGLGDDLQMQITSRFDLSNQNYFLHYMLQKVCNVAFAPQTGSAEDKLLDFLYYLFPSYLKAACAQGIFRAYVTREYNDANVRGPIDVARHIRYNMPFNGKVAYHTREYTTDNKITQLVRHTIEYIRSLSFGGSILDSDTDTRDDVNSIVAATPTYSKNSRMQVLAKNLHPVTHPYYTAYEDLRKLCLAILRHEKLSYGDSDKPIRGILFDGASLWEEYLAKVFEDNHVDLIHSNNRTGENGIQLLVGGRKNHYPDFYRENDKVGNKKAVVLDAKYKKLCVNKNDNDIDKNDSEFVEDNYIPKNGNGEYRVFIKGRDVMQMLAYMYTLEATKTILISPYSFSESHKIQENDIRIRDWETVGYKGEISVFAVPIPANETQWDDFVAKMQNVEKELVKKIKAQIEK
ncbi:hypothetical protein [uncultured Fibrobacter sp.]|uniref:McrC family protein n=1 Tax=uncultured Fibrobacter sp. TaxID=261512 RepID=UPI0025F940CE|nr:hypothetical protein [uncultured Fibrobacter sp.]